MLEALKYAQDKVYGKVNLHHPLTGSEDLKDVAWFLTICFSLTYALHTILYLLGGFASLTAMPILLITMFVPLISAVIVIKSMLKMSLRDFGLEVGEPRYYVYAILYPFLILGLGIPLVILFRTANLISSLEEFKRNLLLVPLRRLPAPLEVEELSPEVVDQVFYVVLLLLPIAPFINATPAFGEEYGWRGYLIQRLMERLGLTFSLLVTGAIWGIWHAPLILMGYNYPSHPNIVGVSVFTLWTIAAGFFIGWLRIKSKSVIVTSIAHGAINAYMGLGLVIAPGHDELLTVPLGLPALLPLALVAAVVYADLRRTLTSK